MALAVSTRSTTGSKPPRVSSRTRRRASSSESSTSRRRSGTPISELPGRRRGPVHEQPVQPELPSRLGEFHEVHRFARSEEHTSELQSQSNLVCRLLLEKKKKQKTSDHLIQ